MMNKIKIESVTSRLTVLDVARERLASAEESLARAKSVYTHPIRVLEDAMAMDDTVIEAQEVVDEYQDLYIEALHDVQNVAVSAWEGGFTDGAKEWEQDEWEIRLRTTKSPTVTNIPDFIDDVHSIRAYSIVKGVTLNKADAVKLHETAEGGVRGLEVEERTSCSLKRIEGYGQD